jgi:hypothetical protein
MKSLLIPALLAAPALAQQVLVVDIAGGTPYQQIQPAIAAANPGDIIEVRPGVYDPFSSTKALRVQGAAGVVIAETATARAVQVSGIPFGSRFVLSRVQLRSDQTPCICEPLMSFAQCGGLIVLEEVGPEPSTTLPPRMQVNAVAGLLASSCTFGPLDISDSEAQLTDTYIGSASRDAGSNVRLSNARFEMIDGFLDIRLRVPLSYGIDLTNSRATLRYVNGLRVRNVFAFSGSFDFFADAQSVVEYHSQTTFDPPFGPQVPPWSPGTVAVDDDHPSLRVTTAGLGGTVTLDMRYSPIGGLLLPFLSDPSGPLPEPLSGANLYLGGAFFLSLGGFSMAGGLVTTGFPVPNEPALSGLPLVVQAVSATPALGLTNAHAFSIR